MWMNEFTVTTTKHARGLFCIQKNMDVGMLWLDWVNGMSFVN